MKEIENRGLDLEAKMKELDLKAEKKSEFKSELDTLNEMLEKVGAELLTVKDGLRLIENGKHELKTASHYIAGLVGKCKRMVEVFTATLEDLQTTTVKNEWTEESKGCISRILMLYSNLVKKYLDDFASDEMTKRDDFLKALQKVFDGSEIKEQRMLNDFNSDLSKVLTRSGIWFSERTFYWLLGIFCSSLSITITVIVFLVTGNVHFG